MKSLIEIREESAYGEIASLYADIRQVTKLPLVNLVYRAIAPHEGCLAWAWSMLRPHYCSGAIDQEAAKLLKHAVCRSPLRPGDIQINRDYRQVNAVIKTYNAANAKNLVAFRALATGNFNFPSTPLSHCDCLTGNVIELPALPRRDQLNAHVGSIIDNLSEMHAITGWSLVPSLYLHLAYWPELLIELRRRLSALVESGQLRKSAEVIFQDATMLERVRAGPHLEVHAWPPIDRRARLPIRLAHIFTTHFFPQLIAVGTALKIGLNVPEP